MGRFLEKSAVAGKESGTGTRVIGVSGRSGPDTGDSPCLYICVSWSCVCFPLLGTGFTR